MLLMTTENQANNQAWISQNAPGDPTKVLLFGPANMPNKRNIFKTEIFLDYK